MKFGNTSCIRQVQATVTSAKINEKNGAINYQRLKTNEMIVRIITITYWNNIARTL